jgi:molecular chaperone GrpE
MTDEDVKDPAEGAPGVTDPPDAAPQADVARLTQERDDYYDRLLRKTAEFDNYRKRVERERREQADQSVVDLLLDLLLVVDDFDRALTVDAGDSAGSYRKGVELIHTKLHDLLRKRGVKAIDASGRDARAQQRASRERSDGRASERVHAQ